MITCNMLAAKISRKYSPTLTDNVVFMMTSQNFISITRMSTYISLTVDGMDCELAKGHFNNHSHLNLILQKLI